MSGLDDYERHIKQKYHLAVAVAVIKSKPKNLTIDQHIQEIRKNLASPVNMDELDFEVCSDDFKLDDDDFIHFSNEKDNTEAINNGNDQEIRAVSNFATQIDNTDDELTDIINENDDDIGDDNNLNKTEAKALDEGHVTDAYRERTDSPNLLQNFDVNMTQVVLNEVDHTTNNEDQYRTLGETLEILEEINNDDCAANITQAKCWMQGANFEHNESLDDTQITHIFSTQSIDDITQSFPIHDKATNHNLVTKKVDSTKGAHNPKAISVGNPQVTLPKGDNFIDSQATEIYTLHDFTQECTHISQSQDLQVKIHDKYFKRQHNFESAKKLNNNEVNENINIDKLKQNQLKLDIDMLLETNNSRTRNLNLTVENEYAINPNIVNYSSDFDLETNISTNQFMIKTKNQLFQNNNINNDVCNKFNDEKCEDHMTATSAKITNRRESSLCDKETLVKNELSTFVLPSLHKHSDMIVTNENLPLHIANIQNLPESNTVTIQKMGNANIEDNFTNAKALSMVENMSKTLKLKRQNESLDIQDNYSTNCQNSIEDLNAKRTKIGTDSFINDIQLTTDDKKNNTVIDEEGINTPREVENSNTTNTYITHNMTQETNLDEELHEIEEENVVPFKVIQEMSKIKAYLNKINDGMINDDYTTDSGYRSDSQIRSSFKSATQPPSSWLNQSGHCLLTFLLECPSNMTDQSICSEISLVLGQFIDRLHAEEKYPPFLDEILENVNELLQALCNEDSFQDNMIMKKEDDIQRMLLLTKSIHIITFTIEKISETLTRVHEAITSTELYETKDITTAENSCYILHLLEILLTRYAKQKDVCSQTSSQCSQGRTLPRKSIITDSWKKKWDSNYKRKEALDSGAEAKDVTGNLREILNKMVVDLVDGHSLVSYAALQCYNILHQ